MNLAYIIAGITMFLIALIAGLLAHNIAIDCKLLSRIVGQLIFESMQNRCLAYIQQEAIMLLFIGSIIYSIIGVISILVGFMSKGEEQHVKAK